MVSSRLRSLGSPISPTPSTGLKLRSSATISLSLLSKKKAQPVKIQSKSSTTGLWPIMSRLVSTMPATHGHGVACCNVPPVIASGYSPKGSYGQLGGLKTYVTGPEDATRGIISVFDIFGYFDQTIQGADIIATGDSHRNYKVFIPDWFDDSPCPIEWYPPDTEQKQKDLGEWFGRNVPQGPAAALPSYISALQAAYPSITSWGLVGYCWGGKVTELVTAHASNPFVIAAALHPAMIDPSGAANIPVPYILLASGEDPVDAVKEFEANLTVPKHVEIFADQVHGWMAARADLTDPHVRDEYIRGYKTVLQFFRDHWP